MGDLNKNFNRSEFKCQGTHCCGHSAPVHPELIKAIQELRELAGCSLIITSGFRCNQHNIDIGGSENSFHTLGMAVDVYSKNHTPEELALLAEAITAFNSGGIGIYKSWIHVDVRPTGMARWRG